MRVCVSVWSGLPAVLECVVHASVVLDETLHWKPIRFVEPMQMRCVLAVKWVPC